MTPADMFLQDPKSWAKLIPAGHPQERLLRKAADEAAALVEEAEREWPNFNNPGLKRRMADLMHSDPNLSFVQAYAKAEHELFFKPFDGA